MIEDDDDDDDHRNFRSSNSIHRYQRHHHHHRQQRRRRSVSSSSSRHPMISLCLLLFILITCFSVSMLVLTQILLSASTNIDPNSFLFGTDTDSGSSSFTSVEQSVRPLFEEFLANITINGTLPINDWKLNLKINSNHTDSDLLITSDQWQPVRSSVNKFFIYSAYLDSYERSNMMLFDNNNNNNNQQQDDKKNFIRIIAVTTLTTKDKIICVYSNSNLNYWFREGKLKPIREHWNLKYSAFFLYCPLPYNYNNLLLINNNNFNISIISVSNIWRIGHLTELLNDNAQKQRLMRKIVPSNKLQIYPEPEDQQESNNKKLAVCIKPLHYHYNKTISLIEFIELNRLLGADRFYFYNHTVDIEVSNLLLWYKNFKPNIIKLLQWSLPEIRSQIDIRTEGIFASLNDCLYRARYERFKYVIFIDLDEFIIPNNHKNLLELVQDVKKIYPGKVGAYSFRNGFFYLQYPDDADIQNRWPTNDVGKNLISLRKTRRKSELNVHKQRSKCIVDTEYTIEMGNHFVWELTQGKHTLNVDPAIGYLHHYRTCEFGGDDCITKTGSIVDQRAHYWSKPLVDNVRSVIQSFCQQPQQQQQESDWCNEII